jgi:hypothetical protein
MKTIFLIITILAWVSFNAKAQNVADDCGCFDVYSKKAEADRQKWEIEQAYDWQRSFTPNFFDKYISEFTQCLRQCEAEREIARQRARQREYERIQQQQEAIRKKQEQEARDRMKESNRQQRESQKQAEAERFRQQCEANRRLAEARRERWEAYVKAREEAQKRELERRQKTIVDPANKSINKSGNELVSAAYVSEAKGQAMAAENTLAKYAIQNQNRKLTVNSIMPTPYAMQLMAGDETTQAPQTEFYFIESDGTPFAYDEIYKDESARKAIESDYFKEDGVLYKISTIIEGKEYETIEYYNGEEAAKQVAQWRKEQLLSALKNTNVPNVNINFDTGEGYEELSEFLKNMKNNGGDVEYKIIPVLALDERPVPPTVANVNPPQNTQIPNFSQSSKPKEEAPKEEEIKKEVKRKKTP